MNRRAFFQISAVVTAASGSAQVLPPRMLDSNSVVFMGDGILLTTVEQARLLSKLAAAGKADRDIYGRGGAVTELEKEMAALLGKERAMFFPTGTMANRVALQRLAGERRRVLAPRESHIYNDEGDGPQRLSGLSLIPLAPGKPTFTVEDIQAELRRFEGGPRQPAVGAIAMECPVRRKDGQLFDYAEMKGVSAYARERGIGLHLDGARLLIASAYTGISPAQYSALVDTVYVSLYKYLNAPGGAILAGNTDVIESMADLRMCSGGNVWSAWPQASIALHYLNGFERRYAQAVRRSDELFRMLEQDRRFRVERLPAGTNISFLQVESPDVDGWTKELQAAGIFVPRPRKSLSTGSTKVQLNVNETLLRRPVEELARTMRETLA